MKTIFKSFKFRIYPNKDQEVLLAKHFGACRFVFNEEKHDRDFNVSKNILKQGLKILSGSGIESDIKQKHVEALLLDESMKPETHQFLADVQFI